MRESPRPVPEVSETRGGKLKVWSDDMKPGSLFEAIKPVKLTRHRFNLS